ncbi:MAG TPA: AraC family transcriptional regulator [Bacteroidales bacterium]|nr:AraC family transcriptional regulator [Bacteroidales bacterium]
MENCSTSSIKYISDHYDQPITVQQLAEIENYNVTYYNDWFKEQTGFPPHLYLRYVRINKAKELLIETDFSIMEIAVMVGYSSNSTLTRAFHSLTGMTPKEYRECPCFKKTV